MSEVKDRVTLKAEDIDLAIPKGDAFFPREGTVDWYADLWGTLFMYVRMRSKDYLYEVPIHIKKEFVSIFERARSKLSYLDMLRVGARLDEKYGVTAEYSWVAVGRQLGLFFSVAKLDTKELDRVKDKLSYALQVLYAYQLSSNIAFREDVGELVDVEKLEQFIDDTLKEVYDKYDLDGLRYVFHEVIYKTRDEPSNDYMLRYIIDWMDVFAATEFIYLDEDFLDFLYGAQVGNVV